jgi:hypothetical protein
MKFICLQVSAIVLFLTTLLYHFSSAQLPNGNSPLEQYSESLMSIVEFENSYHDYVDNLQKASRLFCSSNNANDSLGNILLEHCIRNYKLAFSKHNAFLLETYSCLTRSQKDYVRKRLPELIDPSEPNFYPLVSIYQLTNFKPFLNSHVDNDIVDNLRVDFLDNKLSSQTVLYLNCMSTLANMNIDGMENLVLNAIDSLYSDIHSSKNRTALLQFYLQILPNTLGLLYSKTSVFQTLYFLNETDHGYYGHRPFNFRMHYIETVIVPKITNAEGLYFAWEQEQSEASIRDWLLNKASWRENVSN